MSLTPIIGMTSSMEASCSTEEIQEIANSVEDVVGRFPPAHIVIAFLAIILAIQHPQITPEQLQEGIKGLSQWTCLFLESLDPTTPVTLN